MRTSPALMDEENAAGRPATADASGMPQRIFSLEIGDAELKAAVLQTSFRDYKVAGFFREPLNGDADEQLKRFLAAHSEAGDTILSALPGDRGHLADLLPPLPRQQEARRRRSPSSSRAASPSASTRSWSTTRSCTATGPARRCWRRWCSRTISNSISSCCRTAAPTRRSSASARWRRSTSSAWCPTCRRRSPSSTSARTP